MKLRSKLFLCILPACLLLILSIKSTAEEEVFQDVWTLMRIAGDNAGFVHTRTVRFDEDGRTLFRTDETSRMEMKRFGDTIAISMHDQTVEDLEGNVLRMHRESMMSGVETLADLVVEEGEALVTITTMGKPRKYIISWDPETLGPIGTWKLRKKMGVDPGAEYSYKSFSFDADKVITTFVEVMGHETTELLDGDKAELCYSISTSDFMPGIKMHEWFLDDIDVIKSSFRIMGIDFETYRTTRERALGTKGAEIKSDMLIESMARSNINLPAPYRLDSILYRFKAKDAELGIPEGLEDLRQKILENDGQVAKVLIRARAPESMQKRPMENPPEELREYLEPSAFVQSDHPPLREKALELVEGETDAWKAACRLERFVFEHIKDKNMATGFASAAEVFENQCGDCSEHGVLLAAVCRAAGIPSRVAMGYMYLGGIFGGHMWAEVWINGEWYPLDGVMGIGRVDPTHITFSTSSLKEGGLGESFFSAVQGLGNLDITILEFTRGEKTVKVNEQFKDYIIENGTYTNTLYGISITKPEGYTYEDYERDFSGPNFTLVTMDGDSRAWLDAMPEVFYFSFDNFKERMTKGVKATVLSELPRRVCKREARVYMIEKEGEVHRILACFDGDTCYQLSMHIEDDERDILQFERMVKSIRFSD